MPGRDGTGPMGQGPMTGWGRGFCRGGGGWGGAGRGYGYGFGRGMRRGAGRGFGRGRWGYPQVTPPESERDMLQEEATMLRSELDAITQRLDELSAAPTEEDQ